MKPGGGKGKGSQFEREVGYQLSLWLSKGERKDLLCRTVGSGAQFTAWNSGHPGDLRSQDPLSDKFCSTFVTECKHWADLKLWQFLQGKGDLFKAFVKVEEEGIKTKRNWILIAKQNNQPTILLTSTKCFPPFMFMDAWFTCHGGQTLCFLLDSFLKFDVDKFLEALS